MASVAPRRATYDDLLALPRLGAWCGVESARVAPFEAVELELAANWAR